MEQNIRAATVVEKLIEDLGGPAELARRLGFSAQGGTQRVYNWIKRGRIPLEVQVDYPDLFPADLLRPRAAPVLQVPGPVGK